MLWQTIVTTLRSLSKGMQLTLRHLFQAKVRRPALPIWHPDYFRYAHGRVTLQYPHEQIPVPDNGRYRLHNEIDDCIVCDKCAKICPVDCIEIEAIKSPGPIGTTSDGTVKRLYAAKFNIDMAKCCYCGLCTTVCPTECLTMSKTFDYTEAEVYDLLYLFGNLSKEEIAEKKALWVQYQAEKKTQPVKEKPATEQPKQPKATFKPKVKQPANPSVDTAKEQPAKPTAKPVFKPKIKTTKAEENKDGQQKQKPIVKPKVKPVIKQTDTSETENKTNEKKSVKKPVIKPKIKPVVKKTEKTETDKEASEKKAAKSVIKPKIKPPAKPEENKSPGPEKESSSSQTPKKKPAKPVIKPKIPPKKDSDS